MASFHFDELGYEKHNLSYEDEEDCNYDELDVDFNPYGPKYEIVDTPRGQQARKKLMVKPAEIQEAMKALENDYVSYVIVDIGDGGRTVINRQNMHEYAEEAKMTNHMDPEFLRSEAERMLQRASILEQVPQNDTFEDGQVLYFEKKYGGSVYKYATVKVVNLWFVTGAKSPNGCFWNELVTFIGVNNLPTVRVATATVSLFDYVKGVQKVLEQETEIHNDLDQEVMKG